MTTYTHWDVLLASPTEPLPLKKRQYQMNLMRKALENCKTKPSVMDIAALSTAGEAADAAAATPPLPPPTAAALVEAVASFPTAAVSDATADRSDGGGLALTHATPRSPRRSSSSPLAGSCSQVRIDSETTRPTPAQFRKKIRGSGQGGNSRLRFHTPGCGMWPPRGSKHACILASPSNWRAPPPAPPLTS